MYFNEEVYMLIFDIKNELIKRNSNGDDLHINKEDTPACIAANKQLIALAKIVYKCKEILHKEKITLREKIFIKANSSYIEQYEKYIKSCDSQILFELLFRIKHSNDIHKNGHGVKYYDEDIDAIIPENGIEAIIERFETPTKMAKKK